MNSEQKLIAQIDGLFNPKSVALVGVPRGMKQGKLFLLALQEQGFPGPIYPVHPRAEEIEGLKAYPTVSAIPGPVDLAIVLVSNNEALSVVKDCAAKGVKGAVLFTSGFKELGTEEGKALEEELVRVARTAGMRLIGPNCMGLYSPKSGLAFFPNLSSKPGPVGIVSHSGSLTNILGRIGGPKGIRFSRVVSLGNECDLTSADFLTYLADDPDTQVVGAYLENIRDGKRFLDALKGCSRKKPVILWKAGLTPEGSRAAASHTGALASSREIWESVVRQGGAVPVIGFEEWVDTLMGFSMLPPGLGERMAVISGPGGLAVSAADACGREGLKLAELSPESTATLAKFVPATGTSLKNPIDVGLNASFEIDIYTEAARTAAADPGVDGIVMVGAGLSPETNEVYTREIIRIREELQVPFVMVNIPGFDTSLARRFCEQGVPFFDSAERAMKTYARVKSYQHWRENNR